MIRFYDFSRLLICWYACEMSLDRSTARAFSAGEAPAFVSGWCILETVKWIRYLRFSITQCAEITKQYAVYLHHLLSKSFRYFLHAGSSLESKYRVTVYSETKVCERSLPHLSIRRVWSFFRKSLHYWFNTALCVSWRLQLILTFRRKQSSYLPNTKR